MRPILSADMKEQNRSLVYKYIHDKPGQTVTRTEVSRETGISGPTVLKIFDFFAGRGIIVPGASELSVEPGRKASMFAFRPDCAHAVGASYDGQELELSLVNLNYETVRHERVPIRTDVSRLIGDVLPELAAAFSSGAECVLGIGLSLPAVVDATKNRIRYQAFPALESRMSKEELHIECASLESALGLPVLLENDVNCAAVAEFRALALGEGEDLIYIMLGGGVGAGMVLGGKLRRGSSFACGEIGNMVWDPGYVRPAEGPGYFEWSIYRRSLEQFGVDLLSGGESPAPAELLEHIASELSLSIANLANSLDLSRFVLGGFVCERLGQPLINSVNRRLSSLCIQGACVSPSICPDACSRGAASLLISREVDRLLSDGF